jgi:hypothetical protein
MSIDADIRAAVQIVLRGLYDKPVQVQPAPKFDPGMGKPAILAVFVDNTDKTVGVIVCSLSIAARLGAALSLIPDRTAEDAVKKGILDESLLDNFREVMNICSSLFSEHHGSRVHLNKVTGKIAAPPAEYKTLMASPAARADMNVEIPGYSGGALSVRIAP